MIPFITYREMNEEGRLNYYVLQKEFPHIVGIISEVPIVKFVQAAAIAGYNLWVVFDGTLRGQMIPMYQKIDLEIYDCLCRMANWYLAARIETDEKRFKKYKIISNATTSGK